jgi:hypothetical protein
MGMTLSDRLRESLVDRLRAYITANDDEMAPINMKADYMLISEAADRIEWLELEVEALAQRLKGEGIEYSADYIRPNQ